MKLTEMKQILESGAIQLTKSLGQNFLHDGNQLRRIVEAAELTKTDRGLEGGPGLGPLRELLLERAGVVFFRGRRRDWSDWKLVANLPYSVASPILVELAQSPQRPERMVATLQFEVAQRLMARADDDDYGVLTLLVQLDYEPRASFKIPADCFFPAPNVDSMCVVLQRRARPLLADGQRAAFMKIVKRAFSQRRKMMLKLLKQDWAVDKLAAAFAELKISPQERAEKLSLEQFVELTKLIGN